MPTAVDRPLRQAESALARLREAEDFETAANAWSDFLNSWHRAVNKCDALGRRAARSAWTTLSDEIQNDARLSYLRAARGMDEHGLDPIADRQPGGLGISAVGSVYVKSLVVEAGKVVKADWEPTAPGSKLILDFKSEGISLRPITERKRIFHPPEGANPVALGELAMQFLTGAMVRAGIAKR